MVRQTLPRARDEDNEKVFFLVAEGQRGMVKMVAGKQWEGEGEN